MNHESTEMKFIGTTAAKHTYSNGARKNVWYSVYQCPVAGCGLKCSPLSNTLKGRKIRFVCIGENSPREKRKRSEREQAMAYTREVAATNGLCNIPQALRH